jgi:hypothetical protein
MYFYTICNKSYRCLTDYFLTLQRRKEDVNHQLVVRLFLSQGLVIHSMFINGISFILRYR